MRSGLSRILAGGLRWTVQLEQVSSILEGIEGIVVFSTWIDVFQVQQACSTHRPSHI